LRNTWLFFVLLAALLLAARMCHTGIVWEGDSYPLAAGVQMLRGRMLYRDIWFDKPPLLALAYLVFGALPGWPLRLAGTFYALAACWVVYGFARDLWSEREGQWAAGLLAFFLCFDFPAAVLPVASDLLMLAPHAVAVWLAFRRRSFWCGAVAAAAFWISPKGVFVAAACVLWYPAGTLAMAAGFAAVSAAVLVWLAATGALPGYIEQVWAWGRLYAASPFLEDPLRNGLVRTLGWAGFHASLVIAAVWFLAKEGKLRWLGWLLIALAGVAAGLRFFPRYYLLLLAPMVLMAARGVALMGRRRDIAIVLLLAPFIRFGPAYVAALRDPQWRDTAMDRDSRAAAALIRSLTKPGDSLFVWGYRPELYAYTRLPAATRYLDSQPLTGVPADRHLTQSEPIETIAAARRRSEVARSQPALIADGLALFNPGLALSAYTDLRPWLAHYREIARTAETVIYARIPE
jgi:hypothetical protein